MLLWQQGENRPEELQSHLSFYRRDLHTDQEEHKPKGLKTKPTKQQQKPYSQTRIPNKDPSLQQFTY